MKTYSTNDNLEEIKLTEYETDTVRKFIEGDDVKINNLLSFEKQVLEKKIDYLPNSYEEFMDYLKEFMMLYSGIIKNSMKFDKSAYAVLDNIDDILLSNELKTCVVAYKQDKGLRVKKGQTKVRLTSKESIGYIDIDELLDTDTGKILFAPFLGINKTEIKSGDNNFYYLDLNTGVISGKIKDIESVQKELEQNYKDYFDKVVKFSLSSKRKFEGEFSDISKFTTMIDKLIRAKCAEKILSIYNDKKVVAITDYRNNIIRGRQKISELFDKVGAFKKILRKETEFVELADYLGVPFEKKLDTDHIIEYSRKFENEISKLERKVDNLDIVEELSYEEMQNGMQKVNETIADVTSIVTILTGIEYLVPLYNQNALNEIKIELDKKLFDTSKNIRIDGYKKEIKKIEAKQKSFKNLFTKKKNILALQKKLLELKIKLEEVTKYRKKQIYLIDDILASIYVLKEKYGSDNEELNKMENVILNRFEINNSKVEKLKEKMISIENDLPVSADINKINNDVIESEYINKLIKYYEEKIKFEEKVVSSIDENRLASFVKRDTDVNKRINGYIDKIEEYIDKVIVN